MAHNSARELIESMIQSYYIDRDVEAVLADVTDDIEWIGTEKNDVASGKQQLRDILIADKNDFPDSFNIGIDSYTEHKIGDSVVNVAVIARQHAVAGVVCGFDVRANVCCVKCEAGWLACVVHTSVPNSEMEKYTLAKELDENIKRERLLLSGMPGGVATYRVKKDGRILLEYASDALAKYLGYANGIELLERSKSGDALGLIAPSDRDKVRRAVLKCAETGEGLSLRYPLKVADGTYTLTRLDAQFTKDGCDDDDKALCYTVHTFVSDEAKQILSQNESLTSLIDNVPVGIGIYAWKNGVFMQEYLNDAYYQMIGSTREERKMFYGANALAAAESEDVPRMKETIERLVNGSDIESVTYRNKRQDDKVQWINATVAVTERNVGFVRFYVAFSDYTAIKEAEEKQRMNGKVLGLAMQSVKALTWRYNYKTNTIIDTLTLGTTFHMKKSYENVPAGFGNTTKIAPDSIKALFKMHENMKDGGSAATDVQVRPSEDMPYKWFRIKYTAMHDDNGEYIESIGSAIDIDEQKLREQRYQERVRLYTIAMKDAASTMSINITKNTVEHIEVNDKYYKFDTDLKTADELLASVSYMITLQSELDKFKEVENVDTLLQAYKNGKTHFEIKCYADKVPSWVRVIYDVLENPYTGDIEAVSAVFEITDAVYTETVSRQLFKMDYTSVVLIDIKTGLSIPYSGMVVDERFHTAMSKLKPGQSGADGVKIYFETFSPADKVQEYIAENKMDNIIAHLEKDEYYETTYIIVDEDGQNRYMRQLYSYLDGSNEIIISAAQDITDMYEKEMQQKQRLAQALADATSANKAKTDFLSRVSHDMRTPLNGILGLTELLQDKIRDDADKNDLQQLQLSGEYLLNLINDTLDVSKMESGKLEMRPVVCDGKAIFDNVVTLIKPTLQTKKISFKLETKNLNYDKLYIDVGRTEQVIMNVLGNAVKFTPEGGLIEVCMETISRTDTENIDKIVIKDNGIGMSKEFLPYLFESFSQENTGKTNSFEGTGLGMTITKRIVQLMGGDITAESELGKGTAFTIIMPMHRATPQQIAEWQAGQTSENSGEKRESLKGVRVLLCEDHPLNATIATRILDKKGVITECAENGKIGVDMFAKSPLGYYDLVFMDIRMPVMDGLEATREIRALKRTDAAAVPIVAMTANALDEDVRQAKDAGMDAHIGKPIDVEKMFELMEKVLRK